MNMVVERLMFTGSQCPAIAATDAQPSGPRIEYIARNDAMAHPSLDGNTDRPGVPHSTGDNLIVVAVRDDNPRADTIHNRQATECDVRNALQRKNRCSESRIDDQFFCQWWNAESGEYDMALIQRAGGKKI